MWMEVIESDMKELGLKRTDAVKRDGWRAGLSAIGRRESGNDQPRFIWRNRR